MLSRLVYGMSPHLLLFLLLIPLLPRLIFSLSSLIPLSYPRPRHKLDIRYTTLLSITSIGQLYIVIHDPLPSFHFTHKFIIINKMNRIRPSRSTRECFEEYIQRSQYPIFYLQLIIL